MAWLRRQVMGYRPRAKKYNNCEIIHTDAAIPEKANFGSFALGKLLVNVFSRTHSKGHNMPFQRLLQSAW